MVDLRNVVITSARLQLVSIGPRHTRDVFREFTPEITRYMLPAPPESLADTEFFIQTKRFEMEHGRDLTLAILDREDREFLGCCGVHNLRHRIPELGIWIKKDAHGKKYGKEATAALLSWAGPYLGTPVLRYPVDERNAASRKLIESLGGTLMPCRGSRTVTNQSGETLQEVTYLIRCPL